ncbi:hypothetical protein ACYSNU_16745 [Enterococcus sp. LJL120]
MKVNIELGNIWDMLGAFGTLGAVIVSLWLAKRETKTVIQIIGRLVFRTDKDEDGVVKSNLDRMIQVSAYNAGVQTIGISFLGFGVGLKKVSLFDRLIKRKREELTTHIEYMRDIFTSPELELLAPGKKTKVYEMEINYLYDVGKKYVEDDGTLLVYADFEDFRGKKYIKEIRIEKSSTK